MLIERPRLILADDHPDLLRLIAEMLESEFEVLARVNNGQALVEETQQWEPDLVITDITMPILDGFEAARQLKEIGSQAKIVFLTIHQDKDFLRTAIEVGADGYVIKRRLASDLIPAVREVLAGHQFASNLE